MKWLHTDDFAYLKSENLQILKETEKIEKILINPTKTEIIQEIRKEQFFAVLSFEYPLEEFKNLFVYKRLLPFSGEILTLQEKYFNVSISQALKQRFGLTVFEPKLSFADLGGAFKFKEFCKKIELFKAKKIPLKPILDVGVQGVGKSYKIDCYAGEKNKLLLEANLSLIMEDYNPLRRLNELFEYICDSKLDVVLRLDEFTEMLSNEVLFGELLTLLNGINHANGYEIKGEIFATANDISDVSKKKPQIFRAGRWSKKFFSNYPLEEEANNIAKIYSNKYKTLLTDELVERVVKIANSTYQVEKEQNRCIYTPAEIELLMIEISLFDFNIMDLHKDEQDEVFRKSIFSIVPQLISQSEGTRRLIELGKKNQFEFL